MNTIDLDISTLPAAERLDRWQQVLHDTFGPIQVQPVAGQLPTGAIRSARRGPLAFHAMRYRGMNLSRQAVHVAHLSEEFVTLTLPQTTMQVVHMGQERTLEAGKAYLFNHGVAYRTQLGHEYRTESVAFPAALLRERTRSLPPFFDLNACYEASASVDMIRSFASHLAVGAASWGDLEYTRWTQQLLDMLALFLARAPEDAAEMQSYARTHHRDRALRHIRTHAHDPDLTPQGVAKACGLSLSYLHEVFRDSGLTLEGTIFDGRLELARRWLIDTRRTTVPIRTLCYEAGFSDPSHFSRKFKERFGVTPGELRRSAMGSPGSGTPVRQERAQRSSLRY